MAHFQRQTEHEVNSIFFHYPVYNLAKDNNLRFSFVKNQAKRIQSINGLHKCTPQPLFVTAMHSISVISYVLLLQT